MSCPGCDTPVLLLILTIINPPHAVIPTHLHVTPVTRTVTFIPTQVTFVNKLLDECRSKGISFSILKCQTSVNTLRDDVVSILHTQHTKIPTYAEILSSTTRSQSSAGDKYS